MREAVDLYTDDSTTSPDHILAHTTFCFSNHDCKNKKQIQRDMNYAKNKN